MYADSRPAYKDSGQIKGSGFVSPGVNVREHDQSFWNGTGSSDFTVTTSDVPGISLTYSNLAETNLASF